MTRILVVDANLVYARQVCNVLRSHGRDIEVDVAHNIFILRDRLMKNSYDLVLADIMSAAAPTELMAELEASCLPVVAWTYAPSLEALRKRIHNGTRVMEKPVNPEEATARLSGCFTAIESVV